MVENNQHSHCIAKPHKTIAHSPVAVETDMYLCVVNAKVWTRPEGWKVLLPTLNVRCTRAGVSDGLFSVPRRRHIGLSACRSVLLAAIMSRTG